MSTVLLKDCRATRGVGLGASVWMSKIVLDFVYTEQHEMQKQTFDHRKAKCCVIKANPPWNFARKFEAIMSFKCAKKLRKKQPWKKRKTIKRKNDLPQHLSKSDKRDWVTRWPPRSFANFVWHSARLCLYWSALCQCVFICSNFRLWLVYCMRWLLWCFCLMAESCETINHYQYRLRRQRNFFDSASAKYMRSAPPRSPIPVFVHLWFLLYLGRLPLAISRIVSRNRILC